MQIISKLKARFTNVLDGYSVVNTNLEPIHEDAVTFNFPLESGGHAEVRFSMQDEREERPYAEVAPIRAASENEVLDSIEQLYGMIASGGAEPGVEGDDLSDEHPLWCVNEQIKGLLEGYGATEDHEEVIEFLRSTGLPNGTVTRLHRALVCGESKLKKGGAGE